MEPSQQHRTAAPTSRRKVLGLGAVAAGAAWVAPSIISTPAASAATDPPPPEGGTIVGFVTVCGHELDQGDQFLVTATQVPGGASGSGTTNPSGGYAIAGLPPGTYDILLHPNGPGNTGNPDEGFKGVVVVTAGNTSTFNPDYQANGC